MRTNCPMIIIDTNCRGTDKATQPRTTRFERSQGANIMGPVESGCQGNHHHEAAYGHDHGTCGKKGEVTMMKSSEYPETAALAKYADIKLHEISSPYWTAGVTYSG